VHRRGRSNPRSRSDSTAPHGQTEQGCQQTLCSVPPATCDGAGTRCSRTGSSWLGQCRYLSGRLHLCQAYVCPVSWGIFPLDSKKKANLVKSCLISSLRRTDNLEAFIPATRAAASRFPEALLKAETSAFASEGSICNWNCERTLENVASEIPIPVSSSLRRRQNAKIVVFERPIRSSRRARVAAIE